MRSTGSRKFQLSLVPAVLAVLLPALVTLAAAALLVTRTHMSVDATTQRLYDTHMELVFDAMRQVRALERLQRSGHLIWVIDNVDARRALRRELQTIATDGVLLGNTTNRQLLDDAFGLLDRCLPEVHRQPPAVSAACHTQWQEVEQRLVDQMEALSAMASTSASNDLDTLVDTTSLASRWSLLAVAVAFAALLLLTLFLYVLIARPLMRMTGALERARQGLPPPPGHELLREVQLLDDAAVALAQSHREIQAARTELEAMASTDPLTGLANRREFARASQAELERVRRRHAPLALVSMDIDHFKSINDRFGHEGGDCALRSFAAFLNERLRTVDTAARMGGEEFVIIMPGTALDAALQVAERLRAELAQRPITMPDGSVITLTSSFGVAVVDPTDPDLGATLRLADEALYRAKAGGRNRVEAADPISQP